MTDVLKIASIEDLRPKGQMVQLPSMKGTTQAVLLKKPNLFELITGDGGVPDALSSLLLDSISGDGDTDIDSMDKMQSMYDAMKTVAIATFQEPKLWDQAEESDTHVPVSWFGHDDLAFVMSWAMGAEYKPAANFPPEQSAGVAALLAGEKAKTTK